MESRVERNVDGSGRVGLSTWILKSPVMISSEEELRSSMSVLNSEINVDIDDEGGR